MTVNALIICAGDQTRWKNYLDTPKHLIKIEGEPILHRTVRLIKKFGGVNTKIFIIAKNDNYKINETNLYIPKLNPKNYDTDKFLSSKELWNENGRTIIFYGDVWFSDDCIKKIFNFKKREWIAFSRKGRGKISGGLGGENFAFSFYDEYNEYTISCLRKVLNAYLQKKIHRCGGWELYREIIGLPPTDKHIIKGSLINIEDFTDDFDYPEDYEIWMRTRKEWKKQKFKSFTIWKIRLGIRYYFNWFKHKITITIQKK